MKIFRVYQPDAGKNNPYPNGHTAIEDALQGWAENNDDLSDDGQQLSKWIPAAQIGDVWKQGTETITRTA